MEPALAALLGKIHEIRGRVVALTGAGISAESGIPTFRGPEGYWVVGSRNYAPQEMATYSMFRRNPEEVWRWYLYRLTACRAAQPNAGHQALVDLERALGDRFILVTQNVDGLHRRAGAAQERTYTIHGDLSWVRCAQTCTTDLAPTPELSARDRESPLIDADREKLTCPRCRGWLRPHVLWFDECYDETWYRMESALDAAARADLLLVVGTCGATNLPMQIGALVHRRGAAMVDVNPQPNPFSEWAEASPRGFFAQGSASERLPEIVAVLSGV